MLGQGGRLKEGIDLLEEASRILDALPPTGVDQKIRIVRTAHVQNNWASCLMAQAEASGRADLRDEAATHYYLAIRSFEQATKLGFASAGDGGEQGIGESAADHRADLCQLLGPAEPIEPAPQ